MNFLPFHFHDRTAPTRLFACVACQRPVVFLLRRLFGVQTFVCLCDACGRAMLKKWPDAGTEPLTGAAP